MDRAEINRALNSHPWPLLFATVSGAHLYGFESHDSDYDLRGAHITPAREMLRLTPPGETHELMDKSGPVEIDLVTHDIAKFVRLLLKNNGYVLEQVMSPLVAYAGDGFDELRALARGCITRNQKFHFQGFSQNQWDLVVKSGKPTVKGLLYTYRVLLVGIHLMQTGEVQSNLRRLNEKFRLSYVDDLIAIKVGGAEKAAFTKGLDWHEREFARLRDELEAAASRSGLPEEPAGRAELESLLLRLRLPAADR